MEEQHGTYLKRLNKAVEDPKNLNIAVTGRYGAGKSSVLDKFAEDRGPTTLRLAIATLGPNDEGATLTNRIQKELVKQLVYSAAPRTLRRSRFSRRIELPLWHAIGQAAAAVALLGAFLALMGWLPTVVGTGSGHHWLVRSVAWLGLAAVLVAVGATTRILTHDRFVVSDLSAGGTAVKLSERTPTYFDEYLDEIVNYFDAEDVDVVVFEDLDRFDDPHIFEALRELNTLLNHTSTRGEKGKPLRFVYAVRDSLFEKLGADADVEGKDAATAETMRANRTKFFDLVIPIVPFISHRNARELLVDVLDEAGITGIDRRLLGLVARYATDMRLLRNMRNEYLIFAERLLESGNVAPGLTPSNLFALVAYKNFHLEDFEEISRNASDLDHLYRSRRDLVRNSIAQFEQRKRDLATGTVLLRTRTPLAIELAERVRTLVDLVRARSGQAAWPLLYYKVGNDSFTSDELGNYEFWSAVQAETVVVTVSARADTRAQHLLSLSRDDLARLAPEGMDPDRWQDADDEAARTERADIDRKIALLRSADFADLAANPDYKVSATTAAATTGTGDSGLAEGIDGDCTFAELIDRTMRSELARELVKSGYLDRNFALYAAQFYGHFTGVDVANFVVQNVQSNTMELDYSFTSPGAVANLLDEADDDFTHTVAAYNLEVLNHLLATNDGRATNIVTRLVTDHDDAARTFLTAYMTSGEHPNELAARLAAHPWHDVLIHLTSDDGVPDDARASLVSSALCAADANAHYNLSAEVVEFISRRYRDMAAFTRPQPQAATKTIATILDRAGILVSDLNALGQELRRLVVNSSHYQLTAPNLRTALDITGEVTLDRAQENPTVFQNCLSHPREYLAAVDQDQATQHTIRSPAVLAAVLSCIGAEAGDSTTDTVSQRWNEPLTRQLLAGAAPSSALLLLAPAPTSTWTWLAEAKLFTATLANLEAYRAERGEIDHHLAGLLIEAGAVDTDDAVDSEATKEAAAVALLNATTIRPVAIRVTLVESLGLDRHLPVDGIHPDASDLFALLLEHDLVADDEASFAHFHAAGWPAIGPAIAVSAGVSNFLSPGLVQGLVGDLLVDPTTRAKVGRQIVTTVETFVPDNDQAALQAVGEFADTHGISLAPDTVIRIANAAPPSRPRVLRLLRVALPDAVAQQIIEVFTALGRPYDAINDSGSKFNVSYDDLHAALLTTLQSGSICTFRKKRGRNLFEVHVN